MDLEGARRAERAMVVPQISPSRNKTSTGKVTPYF
jgi:hypothetical protein